MPGALAYRKLSFWHDTVPGSLEPRDPLDGDLDADVAIAGAGFTGLWTAYYLKKARPELRVVVCEREIAGFGASGRNGGWCSALFPASLANWTGWAAGTPRSPCTGPCSRPSTRSARLAAAEGIDCHWAKGGTVQLARSAVQLERARAEIAEAREFGFGQEDLRLLDRDAATAIAAAAGVLGGVYTPHCAAIHPSRLARGLAEAVRRRGVALHETHPGHPHRARRSWSPRRARSGPGTSSGPPRGTRRSCRASTARSCRCTR